MEEPKPFSFDWWEALAAELRARGLDVKVSASYMHHLRGRQVLLELRQGTTGGAAIESYDGGMLNVSFLADRVRVRPQGDFGRVANTLHVAWLKYVSG